MSRGFCSMVGGRQGWLYSTIIIAGVGLLLAHGAAGGTLRPPAAIPANCSSDATQSLNRWLATVPDGTVVRFPAAACYRVQGTLEVEGRNDLEVDGNGATIRAAQASQRRTPIWQIVDSQHIVVADLNIVGAYTRAGTFDPKLQSAHGIAALGSELRVEHVAVSGVGGDCVYYGPGRTSAQRRSSGTVSDSTCVGTGRNGVSVVSGDNINVTGTSLDRIGYDVFDVEPNLGTSQAADHVNFERNIIGSYHLEAYSVVGTGPVSNQSFVGNRIVGHGLKVAITRPGVSGTFRPRNVVIRGNRSDTAQAASPINVDDVDGLLVADNTVPMGAGSLVAVTRSCNARITRNVFPGGTSEAWFRPWICSLNPATTDAGSILRIIGTGFLGARAVEVNGGSVSFTVESPGRITLSLPKGIRSGLVMVRGADGVATNVARFTRTGE